MLAGAVASAINTVAGGGSLITYPVLTNFVGLSTKVANATNSVGLWPGSLGSVFGFWNLFQTVKPYVVRLALPTALGSIAGAELLILTKTSVFDAIVPVLILFASLMLLAQKRVKELVLRGDQELHPVAGMALQFLVAVYGGYFGAGMGIMMMAAFALYMKGTLHEINAVKSFLGIIINLVASSVFLIHSLGGPAADSLIDFPVGLLVATGGLFGGFFAARLSQKINPDKLRLAIAVYGLAAAAYYAAKALHLVSH